MTKIEVEYVFRCFVDRCKRAAVLCRGLVKRGWAAYGPTTDSGRSTDAVLPPEFKMRPVIAGDIKPIETKIRWHDEFDGDLSKWYQDDFTSDPLHRTGYKHLELDGSVNETLDHQKVPGRWAALMDKHRDKVQFIRNGQLVMRGHVVKQANHYRRDFENVNGKYQAYGQYQLYAPWLSTWARRWSNTHSRHITDWSKTTMMVGPGSVIETRVNFEKQTMGGFRFSMFVMPATDAADSPEGNPATVVCDQAYNADPSIVEIDVPEVENPKRYSTDYGHRALLKIVGGAAGDTPNGLRDLRPRVNLRKGWHTFTLIWARNGALKFLVDGIEFNYDDRLVTMQGYLILSCEMNSGCKDPDHGNVQAHENTSNGPYQPADPGLTARSVIDDIDLIDEHEVLVDYVRVYDIL